MNWAKRADWSTRSTMGVSLERAASRFFRSSRVIGAASRNSRPSWSMANSITSHSVRKLMEPSTPSTA